MVSSIPHKCIRNNTSAFFIKNMFFFAIGNNKFPFFDWFITFEAHGNTNLFPKSDNSINDFSVYFQKGFRGNTINYVGTQIRFFSFTRRPVKYEANGIISIFCITSPNTFEYERIIIDRCYLYIFSKRTAGTDPSSFVINTIICRCKIYSITNLNKYFRSFRGSGITFKTNSTFYFFSWFDKFGRKEHRLNLNCS